MYSAALWIVPVYTVLLNQYLTISHGNGQILNPPHQPTFKRDANGLISESTLDLFVASPIFATNFNTSETLEVSPVVKFQNKYFHLPITATFNMKNVQKSNKISHHVSRVYERADWDKVKNEMDRLLIDLNEDDSAEQLSLNIGRCLKKAADYGIP